MNLSLQRLREHCRSIATRPFKARGSIVKRCDHCMMATFTCMCQWRKELDCELQFILIMHRKEVLKPTNTGRLIADLFPNNTQVFLWDRTEPSPELLEAINHSPQNTFVLFPSDTAQPLREHTAKHREQNNQTMTIVLLDGTWKQATKMMRLSPWLQHLPHATVTLDTLPMVDFIRKAQDSDQLSTAQAAAYSLINHGELEAGTALHHSFIAVSYTHLTLPTILRVEILLDVGSLNTTCTLDLIAHLTNTHQSDTHTERARPHI